MGSYSNNLPVNDTLKKLTSRIEAVEKFISRQFGNEALCSVNDDSDDNLNSLNKHNLPSDSDLKLKPKTRRPRGSKRRTSSSYHPQATSKRTRLYKRISYKEDESNSEYETETKENDFNTLLVPKNEIEDPSYYRQDEEANSYFEGDDGSGVQNSEQESGGDDEDTNASWCKEKAPSVTRSKGGNSSGPADDSEIIPTDKDSPWMQEDYVPPTLLPAPGSKRSNCLVLAFRDHTYSLDSKCKITVGTRKEKNKKTWKCSIGGGDIERCKARMYTWGPEYKVLGFWGEHNHAPRTEKIESRIFMDKLKKIATTTDLSITEIVDNALKDVKETTKSLLPDVRTIRRILNYVRRPMTSQKFKSSRLTTPCFNHLINKLKQGEMSSPNNKSELQDSACSSKQQNSVLTSVGAATNKGISPLMKNKGVDINNLRSNLSEKSDKESDITDLLIPKTEMVSFNDCPNEDDFENQDIHSMDVEGENDLVFEECSTNENDLSAPCMQEGYEPPFLLEKGNTKRLLVYGGYTYALRARHKNTLDECSGMVIRERRESEKKIWRCSLSNANRDNPINCGATIYTWGPEYKVLGFMGEHSHPPRTEEIKKRIFLDKLKEIARTTDIPINDILEDALKDATEDLKAVLPKLETMKCHLRIARNEIKPHVVNRLKITNLAKQMSVSGTSDNRSSIALQQIKGMMWNETSDDSGQYADLNRETGNNVQTNVTSNSTEEVAMHDDDSAALWMKDDYVPPTVLPSKASATGRVNSIVLAFKGHIYCADYKCKQSDLANRKERDKINWKCNFAGGGNSNIEGERCKARIYTWGPEYKVLGMWGEHNHPPMTEKIERRVFMEKLKRIAATTEIAIPEIVSEALSETSEEFKETLPKLESIYQILRKIRHASFGKPDKDLSIDDPGRRVWRNKNSNKSRKVNVT